MFAQKAIQLTNKTTGKKLKPITTGARVAYFLKPVNGKSQSKAITGILSEISTETLTVNGVTFNVNDLYSFGTKKKGSGFGSFLLSGFGTALVVGAISNQTQDPAPPCRNCHVVTTGEDKAMAGTVVLSGIGLGMNVLSINKIIKNSPRNLKKWDLEIIDPE
ncbi:hypothetical protein I5M27_03935 [Adhaeribacter sp. BT258]|uniref:Uncharacterized protein n=1 Tax=Adhaeribacter terrigena TaxID=2793070 RepID=A0ABS1BYD7_9BACT|nr:hypothetical protein [Adhaeribacter terrigena]MBK0402120.1 hypothetical protein [Adhaeribacter terrigena]